jgi:CheY-like chemotaxis protein
MSFDLPEWFPVLRYGIEKPNLAARLNCIQMPAKSKSKPRSRSRSKAVRAAPRILIVDDNEFMRWAIRNLIAKSRPGWEVCGEAANGAEAVRAASSLKPDVVILDESMPIMSGLQAASRMAKLGLRSRILMLTAFEPKDISLVAESAGLPSYPCVDKSRSGIDLLPLVDSLIAES